MWFQFCCFGENYIASERLLNVYSISKNILFLSILYSFTLIIISIYLLFLPIFKIDKINKSKCHNYFRIIIYIILLLAFVTIITFTISIVFIGKTHLRKEDFDYIILSDVIFYKCLDLIILSFFDFLDNRGLLNTSFFIKLERLIWSIIEVLFEVFEVQIKTIFIFRLVFSVVFLIVLIFASFFYS